MEDILKMIEKLGDNDSKFARKALNYYDGKQTQELINFLSDSSSFRKHWREKGMVPRSRNITKAIVDKSGLLFSGPQPKLEVWAGGKIDQVASDTLLNLMDNSEWIEFFTNFDNQVRLLKTGIVLIQQSEEGRLILDALHRGNCVVKIDSITRQIKELLFMSDADGETYRHFTAETIVDYSYDNKSKTLIIEGQQENTYGVIPAAIFHDTATPRCGVWNIVPHDLVGMNEAYNIHLMESEYAAAWAKVKTLFTNAKIDGSGGMMEAQFTPDSPLPRYMPTNTPAAVGGPGRIVEIDAGPGMTPYVEYKGPDVSLEPIDGMFASWVKDFAADWSVRLAGAGNGMASSGFQLIVEEMPNLELRRSRQKMMNAGFARFYRVLVFVMNGVLPADGELFIEFSEPSLPVDKKVELEVWARKISEGLATREDYFMEIEGMTAEEARAKVIRIDASTQAISPVRQSTIRVV